MAARFVVSLSLAFIMVATSSAQDAPPSPSPSPTPSPEETPEPERDATPVVRVPETAPTPSPSPSAEPTPEPPYVEGWHAGSPPGDTLRVRFDYWLADTHGGPLWEIDHSGRRVGVFGPRSLGYGQRQQVLGGDLEYDAGSYGFYELDYEELIQSARVHSIGDSDHIFIDTLFPKGDLVQSRIEQHYAKLRDGVDVRYRIPLGEESSLDIVFAPSFSLAVRYESFDVSSLVSARKDGSHFFALTLLPGFRGGVDLRLPASFMLRAGAELDWLPELPHVNPFSFTREPSIREWHDARTFVALRWSFLELDCGWRFFEVFSGKGSQPGGGRLRRGDAYLSGFDAGASLVF